VHWETLVFERRWELCEDVKLQQLRTARDTLSTSSQHLDANAEAGSDYKTNQHSVKLLWTDVWQLRTQAYASVLNCDLSLGWLMFGEAPGLESLKAVVGDSPGLYGLKDAVCYVLKVLLQIRHEKASNH
jgi:hypothetical protein